MNGKRVTVTLVLLLVCCLVVAGCFPGKPAKGKAKSRSGEQWSSARQPVAGKKLLLVQSYHPQYPWVESLTRGVIDRLSGTGVEYEIFYMDTKRRPDEASMIQAGERAIAKVEEYKPDIVIAADDNAQQYFAMKYVGQDLPIVFCGLNADPAKYGYPASNVTGILERPNVQDTLEFLNRLRPIKRVAVISSNDSTSAGALSFIKQVPTNFEIVEVKLIGDFDEWKAAVARYNGTVDALGVYSYHTLVQKDGTESLQPAFVMNWTADNVTIPTFGFAEFTINDGGLLGVVQSPYEHGEKAAEYALEVLAGTPISSLPVVTASAGLKMLNRRTAERLGIDLTTADLEGVRIVPER